MLSIFYTEHNPKKLLCTKKTLILDQPVVWPVVVYQCW
jgi:hypothetical protein